MPRAFAYLRVSTAGQTTDNQLQEIEAAGFKVEPRRVITETISGNVATSQRRGFTRLVDRLRQIAENSGVEGSIVVGKISENSSETYGFDAQTEQFVDLIQAGIIDPAKVVRAALQDAASVAGLLITTEAMVAEAPKKETAPAMPGGGMGGMDY